MMASCWRDFVNILGMQENISMDDYMTDDYMTDVRT
jgi:hypothetical protein